MSSKPRLSVAERRRLKKQQQQQANTNVTVMVIPEKESSDDLVLTPPSSSLPLKTKTTTTVLILCGISASGKSSFVKNFQHVQEQKGKTVFVISRDALRMSMFGYDESTLHLYEEQDKASKYNKELLINEMENKLVEQYVHYVDFIVFDNTNLRADYINKYRNQFYRPTTIHLVVFPCTPDEAIEHQELRIRQVPHDVILYQYDMFQKLQRDRELRAYVRTPSKMLEL